MSSNQKNESLSDLLKNASKTFDVPIHLLNKILSEERVYLYLPSASRQSVRKKIREIIQEAVRNEIP
jgi:hypothetical protein